MTDYKVLITGAAGQLGTVLARQLSEIYTSQNVVISDIQKLPAERHPSIELDVTDFTKLKETIEKHEIKEIYHLAAILSATGERKPRITKSVNSDGFYNILEAAKKCNVNKIFYPSSIAVFGKQVPKIAPQYATLIPSTVYGITKAEGENWSQYYYDQYGLDVRSLRFPGVIGHQSMPGGGTTDYAVDIFYAAVQGEKFSCFLKPDEYLPMIYMDDSSKAIKDLMAADKDKLTVRTSYNLSGLSFSPEEIYEEIKKHIPSFEIEYNPDFRQDIAASWPDDLDDSLAREDWGWKPDYDLPSIVEDMLTHIEQKLIKS